MILVCPSCDSRYTLKPTALGVDGKDVRCAKCTHTWFQRAEELEGYAPPVDKTVDKPVESPVHEAVEKVKSQEVNVESLLGEVFDETKVGATEDVVDINAIPDAVKPVQGTKPTPVFTPATMTAKLIGALASLILAGIMIAGAVFMKDKVIEAWPPSHKLYELVGVIEKPKEKTQLVIENVVALVRKSGGRTGVLVVQGRVINLTETKQPLPDLIAQLRSTNGEDGEKWFIKTPLDALAPNESFSFATDYPNVPRGIGSVNVTFDEDL